jgi:hypothetical protein
MNESQRDASPLIPYAAFTSRAQPGDVFRNGDVLIVRDGITLRDACILCGKAGAGQPLRLKFSWDSSFQVAKSSTLELRRAGMVRASMCEMHLGRWRSGRIMGAVGMGASAVLMAASAIVAVVSESSTVPLYTPHAIAILLVGFALFIGFMFLFTLRTRTLTCQRIENGYLYLEGVGEEFLEGIEPLPRQEQAPA